MPTAIAMPRLGMTMREGTLLEWRVGPGESIAKGEPVLVIESEKAEVEIESPAAGVLRHIYVEAGARVACGTLLGALTPGPDEPFDPEGFRAEHRAPAFPAQEVPRKAPSPSATQAQEALRGGAPVTPAARRRALELGMDLAHIVGSGPGGRIRREDVEEWAERFASRLPVAEGVSLEVKKSGQGAPVILLPGFGADFTAFARQIPTLAERYRVTGINPRGVGLSDAPAQERYDLATSARDAAAAAGGAAHWIGASLGAAVALEMALQRPETVLSLTLLTPFVRARERLLAVIEAWCRLAAEAPAETAAAALVPWLFSASFLAQPLRRERATRALAEILPRTPALTLRRVAEGIRQWSGSREKVLDRIAAPTLIVAAGEDLLTPGAEALSESIPKARAVVVPGAGHAVALEAPESVNEVILQHLSEVTSNP